MPKGQFVVMKTGVYPMKVRLKLFFEWGISFGAPYAVKENANRKVQYAEKKEIMERIVEKYCPNLKADEEEKPKSRGGIRGMGGQTQAGNERHASGNLRTSRAVLRTSSIKRQYPLPAETLAEEETEQGENEPT